MTDHSSSSPPQQGKQPMLIQQPFLFFLDVSSFLSFSVLLLSISSHSWSGLFFASEVSSSVSWEVSALLFVQGDTRLKGNDSRFHCFIIIGGFIFVSVIMFCHPCFLIFAAKVSMSYFSQSLNFQTRHRV